MLSKAARAEERKREVDAKRKAKADKIQARHDAAQARCQALLLEELSNGNQEMMENST